jgi:hypothetical protein
MKGRTTIALAGLGAGVVSAVVVGGFAIAGGDKPAAPAYTFDHISNSGSPVDVSASNAETLRGGGGQASLRRLATRNGTVFYTAPGATGGLCYAKGPENTGGIALLGCPNAKEVFSFPSREKPILEMSGGVIDSTDGSVHLLELSGFAADGVAKVGLIDVNGVIHSVNVSDNVYDLALPNVEAKAVVALDGTGREIYRRDHTKR